MFVFLRDVSAAKQVIATLLAVALILWASGAFNIGLAQAANITDVYILLDDSAPSASSTQLIEFVTPSGIGSGATITVSYPAGFNLASIVEDDVDVAINGVDEDTAAAPTVTDWGVSVVGQNLQIVLGSGETVAGNATVTIEVGSNASFLGTGTNEISNPPSPTNGNESFEITISAGASDSGATRVVILDTVLVTAQVATQFDFTVTGLAASSGIYGTSTTLLSTSTTIPFGELSAFQQELIAQQLNVNTNAANGYVVTVQKDGAFESSTGADIDDFVDGTLDDDTPVDWAQPSNVLNSENTYGHWGVTSDDTDTNGNRNTEFSAGSGDGTYVGIGLQAAPTVVMAHSGPVAGQVTGQGSTTVGYSVEITPLQEAGDDYEAILTYIATPTF